MTKKRKTLALIGGCLFSYKAPADAGESVRQIPPPWGGAIGIAYGAKYDGKGELNMLTGKQEKFIRNLIQGMSQREAYKNSYDTENMTDKSIDEVACRLFNDDKIKSRYNELIERAANASVMTAQERLEYLTAIIYGIEQEQVQGIVEGVKVEFERPADLNTRMKAIDIMNKMQGEYVTKIAGEVSVKLEDLL